MKQREYFLYAKNIKITIFFSTIRLLSVSPHQRSAILDITHQTHAAYALLHPPQHKDAYSTCIYALIWMKIEHLFVEADAEERTLRELDRELTRFCGTPIVFRIFFSGFLAQNKVCRRYGAVVMTGRFIFLTGSFISGTRGVQWLSAWGRQEPWRKEASSLLSFSKCLSPRCFYPTSWSWVSGRYSLKHNHTSHIKFTLPSSTKSWEYIK